MIRARRIAALCAAAVLAGVVVSGCNADVGSTGTKGYIAGSGITVLAEADRRTPGPVSGQTLEGKQVSLADYHGKVVVVNVWGSWCGPCRSEAADLVKAATDLAGRVVFLGINTRDNSRDSAIAFETNRNVPYSSIYDPGGRTLLAFRSVLPPNAIPTTLVIDAQGRVAARILGPVPSAQTVVDLVDEVNKGTAP